MSRLNSFDVSLQLSHECCVFGIHIKPSTIAHSEAGMGCFANQVCTVGDPIWYNNGTMVFQFWTDALKTHGVHRDGVMATTREQFHNSPMSLAKESYSLDGVLHTV